ncbi:MAG TPA: malto-oligosyltrehalose trehalohydrolase [Polyangiaceae bacterium]|nr:malto-oligosyltrehalose trehalohydrolase [Polyangiaceae bacterium]
MAIGAEPLPEGGCSVRIWAPEASRVDVVRCTSGKGTEAHALEPEANGYYSGVVPFLGVGDLYGFRLDGADALYPDPASRFQPEGPHGPSEVIDPSSFPWTDATFPGLGKAGHVIYELHVGTFTREGTYRAATEQLGELRKLGITIVELMPVCEFAGRFGWGYDGVDLFAPTRLYGRPDDLRRFVDEAHRHGIGVILDVVYNHLGPDGNYLKRFSKDYFTDRYRTEWGEPLNFDGPNSAPVREFFIENARHWITEYHFDGLRLDATQCVYDATRPHVLAEITRAAREAGRARGASLFIVAENEPQHAELARPLERGGYGCDALWNDDFHHTAMVALTGRHEAYYSEYRGSPQELISALKWGYLYQGQHYFWQGRRRGHAALDLEATSYVTYIQNHDQIANSLAGARIDRLTSPALLRAMTALFLLAPPTPMLFQGQEFAASAPFLYFADHPPELARLVDESRKKFLEQFPSIAMRDASDRLERSSDPHTFERCKLDFTERETHREIYDLHRELLALRRTDPAFAQQRADLVHGSVLGPECLLLRFVCSAGDRLLVTNLGQDLELRPAPEPLLAPPAGTEWQVLWSSEHPRYGGLGYGEPWQDGIFEFPGRSTTVLHAVSERARGGGGR